MAPQARVARLIVLRGDNDIEIDNEIQRHEARVRRARRAVAVLVKYLKHSKLQHYNSGYSARRLKQLKARDGARFITSSHPHSMAMRELQEASICMQACP